MAKRLFGNNVITRAIVRRYRFFDRQNFFKIGKEKETGPTYLKNYKMFNSKVIFHVVYTELCNTGKI